MKKIYLFFKRTFDIVSSFLALVLLAVPFLIIAVIIKCTSKGPVFFKQKRVGKNKKLFTILKFRTMRIDAPKDTATHLLNDAEAYITSVGKFLRKTSLDELPQIFNIFVGQMSVIGPRPALYNQYDLIELRDRYNANSVRPGLTGLAQISGRDELEIEKKSALDGEYVKNISFLLDAKIFFKTIFSVFRHEGVVEGGTGTIVNSAETGNEDYENEDKPDTFVALDEESEIKSDDLESSDLNESEETFDKLSCPDCNAYAENTSDKGENN